VTIVLFHVVGQNDYLQSQILAKLKFIQGKMEILKARLELRLCHPIGNIFDVVADGNNISLKRKLDLLIA